ncbi:hypothetical protein ACWDVX_22270 [Streptomyces tendae]
MRTRATITLAAALLLAVTGCSSNDDSSDDAAPATSSSASTPTAEPTHAGEPTANADLVQAVKDYTAAYFASDADRAYAALSARCQGEISAEAYRAVVQQAKTEFGPDHPATDVEADVQGEMARVSYKVKGLPKFDQTKQPWAYESGEWKFDAC